MPSNSIENVHTQNSFPVLFFFLHWPSYDPDEDMAGEMDAFMEEELQSINQLARDMGRGVAEGAGEWRDVGDGEEEEEEWGEEDEDGMFDSCSLCCVLTFTLCPCFVLRN